MVEEELRKLSEDANKLKSLIYDNKIIFKPSKAQEDSFYRTVDSLINRISYHIEQYSEMNHVIETKKAIEYLNETNYRKHVSFKLDEMKSNLANVYVKYLDSREKDTNFIAAVEPTIFYPIRILIEKLYREMTKNKADISLNEFFEDKNI